MPADDFPFVVFDGPGDGHGFSDAYAAALYLLQYHCTPVQIQKLRGDAGRELLRSFPVRDIPATYEAKR